MTPLPRSEEGTDMVSGERQDRPSPEQTGLRPSSGASGQEGRSEGAETLDSGESEAVRKVLDAARDIDWYDVRALRDIGGLDGLVERLNSLVAAIDGLDFPDGAYSGSQQDDPHGKPYSGRPSKADLLVPKHTHDYRMPRSDGSKGCSYPGCHLTDSGRTAPVSTASQTYGGSQEGDER